MHDREIVSGESEFSSSHVDRKASGRPRRWTRATAGFFGLAFIVVLIDQVSKYWIETTLAEGEYVPVVGDVFGLRLIYNPGAAFSFGTRSEERRVGKECRYQLAGVFRKVRERECM